MEIFFRSLKTEQVYLTCYASYHEAKTDLFDYIRFYSKKSIELKELGRWGS
ncbi:transposase InsF for insertion sequence IS3A/B/C/D/E/fA [Pseudomonas aeruginosa]|uniref:IS3 family transposase n=1 Tax=Pseudomonas aeruginosa TaxID=287 RepID=UPI0009A5A33D|nr:hypothetical protein DY968_29205 [Pseudomonas aeruginosa]SQC94929.1 transposase InsF for insertion sequence IS3A/B/C/D/E/fA [Pseudomonas aeruginosa]